MLVRLRPVALAFVGQAKFEQVDETEHKACVKAQGRDSKGRGGANATVDFRLVSVEGGSKVLVHTDLVLSGSVAQYGRAAGMVQNLASQLIGQFATALKIRLAARSAPVTAASASAAAPSALLPAAKPIADFSLLLKVLWNTIIQLFKCAASPT